MHKAVPPFLVRCHEKKRVAEFVKPNARLRYLAAQLDSLTVRCNKVLSVRITTVSPFRSFRYPKSLEYRRVVDVANRGRRSGRKNPELLPALQFSYRKNLDLHPIDGYRLSHQVLQRFSKFSKSTFRFAALE